jgi:hypothetical protein
VVAGIMALMVLFCRDVPRDASSWESFTKQKTIVDALTLFPVSLGPEDRSKKLQQYASQCGYGIDGFDLWAPPSVLKQAQAEPFQVRH